MNFGLAFATGKIPGINVNLLSLNQNHEPESAEAALNIYSHLLLPERNQEENIKRLSIMLSDKTVADKIAAASDKHTAVAMTYQTGNNSTVSQVTGVIIGSPEFQRK